MAFGKPAAAVAVAAAAVAAAAEAAAAAGAAAGAAVDNRRKQEKKRELTCSLSATDRFIHAIIVTEVPFSFKKIAVPGAS